MKSALEGNADTAPDVYDFSVAGLQGRFLIQDTSVVLLPQQPVQIRRLRDGTGFQVATETGIRYIFGSTGAETTEPHHQNFGNVSIHFSTWHLTQIISAGNTDTIRFHYSTWRYKEEGRVGQTTLESTIYINYTSVDYLEGAPHNSYVYGSIINTKLLDSITTRSAQIQLQRDANHVVQSVSTLSTLRGNKHVLRTTELGHSAFASLSNLWVGRLRLDWVQERNGAQRMPAYRFAYDTTQALPPTTSTGQDHWGYYNGADTNGKNNIGSALLPHRLLVKQGLSANREPDSTFAQAGALRRITYPTGGSTTITYEPNRYAIENRSNIVNDPIYKTAFLTSPIHMNGSRLRPARLSVYGELPGDYHAFTLTEDTDIEFSVQVRPYLVDNENFINKRPDFFLLKQVTGGDTVLLYGKGAVDAEGFFRTRLTPGRYEAWIVCESLAKSGDTFAEDGNELIITFPRKVYTPDVAGDGMRVRREVTTTMGSPPLTRTYSYQLATPDGPCSSGTMLLPITRDGQPIYQLRSLQVVPGGTGDATKTYAVSTSDITLFGDEYKKYSFYYARVTERESDSKKEVGKTVHYYTHQPDYFNEVLPVMVETYGTRTGSSDLQLVQVERSHYRSISSLTDDFIALRPYVFTTTTALTDKTELYRPDFFRVQANLLAADSTVTVRYDATGKVLTTATITGYRQQRPVRSTERDSQGNLHVNAITYLSDYSPTLPDFARLRAHNFNPVIEVQHWLRPASRTDSLVTGGELTFYDAQWQRPASTWKLDLSHPQFGFNAHQTTNGYFRSFLSDTHYRRLATEYYDHTTGDPTGSQPAHAPATAYIWGYKHTLPLAQVQNALPTQVAYAGFEAGELGRWQGQVTAIVSPGYTGFAGYDLAAGLLCTGLPAGQYQLSCRQQGTGSLSANGQALQAMRGPVRGWTEYGAQVTIGWDGLVKLAGTEHIDEVRLHPVGARMTSYTHEFLVGESSVTDPSGRTTTYEYDALGRLLRTRDEQGRIVSQQQYHYAGQ